MADSNKPVDPAPAPEAEAEAPAIEDKEAEPEAAKTLEPACLDLTHYKPKVDHFENLHVLPAEEKVEGAPNFRQVRYRVH